jgi:ribonucleoside-triphosphate reductase (thioredoxin)
MCCTPPPRPSLKKQVTFDPETEGKQLKQALDIYQYQLKGISFLPKLADGAYEQMPYEEVTEMEYVSM